MSSAQLAAFFCYQLFDLYTRGGTAVGLILESKEENASSGSRRAVKFNKKKNKQKKHLTLRLPNATWPYFQESVSSYLNVTLEYLPVSREDSVSLPDTTRLPLFTA